MMRNAAWAAVVGLSALGVLGGASGGWATVVEPGMGVAAVDAVVGGNPGTLTVTGGTGAPGYPQPNYNPKGFFAPVYATSSGTASGTAANGSVTVGAAGYAIADLASGQFHLVGQAVRAGGGLNGVAAAAIASSATMSDVLTVTGAITAPVTVRLSMVVSGHISGAPDSINGLAAFALDTNGNENAEVFLNKFDGVSVQEQDYSSYGGKVVTDAGIGSNLTITLYDDVVVTDTSRVIDLVAYAELNLLVPDIDGVTLADFGDTARLGVSLPAGLGFTSLSGVFLTQPQDDVATEVVEPASLWVLGAGVVGMAALRQRRGRVRL